MKHRTAQWVLKAEEDMEIARTLAAIEKPKRDGACFHCQQAAEKYLKALLLELGLAVPRTHELTLGEGEGAAGIGQWVTVRQAPRSGLE